MSITNFGDFIRFLREECLDGMSRREFCEITKIPNITIQSWEYGKSEPPIWAIEAMINYLICEVFKNIDDEELQEICIYKTWVHRRLYNGN